MARGRRMSRRSGPKRKVYWVGQQEGLSGISLIASTPAGGYGLCVSWWTVWPSDRLDPVRGDVMASDRTLAKTILNCHLGNDLGSLIPSLADPPVEWCLGLIAYDGGFDPSFYEQASWTGATPGAPPHPCLQSDDDWIIRLPFMFLVNGQEQGPAVETFIISKAMRKLPPGVGVLAVLGGFSIDAGGVTSTIDACFDFRHLLKAGYVT